MTRNLKTYRTLLLALVLLFVGWQSPARATGLTLLNFQAAGMAVYQPGGNSQYFPQASWTPYLELEAFAIRGELGFTFLKNNVTADRFAVINYDVLASIPLIPALSIEAGAGIHNWVNNGGAGLAITANLVFFTVAGLDRVFVGYSRFFKSGDINELRLGVGFTL